MHKTHRTRKRATRAADHAVKDLATATGYSVGHVSRWLRESRPAKPLAAAVERVIGLPADEVRARLLREVG